MTVIIWDNGDHRSSHAIWFIELPGPGRMHADYIALVDQYSAYRRRRLSTESTVPTPDYNARILAVVDGVPWRTGENKTASINSWWDTLDCSLDEDDDDGVSDAIVKLAMALGLPAPFWWLEKE